MENEVDKLEQVFADTLSVQDFQRLLDRNDRFVNAYITASTAESLRILNVSDTQDLRDVVRP